MSRIDALPPTTVADRDVVRSLERQPDFRRVFKANWLAPLLLIVLGSAVHAEGFFLTVDEIKGFYPEIFDARPNRVPGSDALRGTVSVDIAEVPEGNPLAPLITENPHLIRYVLSSRSLAEEDLQAAVRMSDFPGYYFELLRNDAAFNSTFLEIVDRYLRGRGGGVPDYQGRSGRRVAFDDVLDTAVRFVYPSFIDEEGNVGAQICSGINGLADLALEPDPFLEALVYSAIAAELHVGDSPVQKKISYALALARDLSLSTDEEIALARAQGVVWAVLKESPEFRESLRRQYERIGVLLPISIDFGDRLP